MKELFRGKGEFAKAIKNKEFFKVVHTLKDYQEAIRATGIGQIIVFDEVGMEFDKWKFRDELVLSVCPLNNATIFEEEGDEIKSKLIKKDIKVEVAHIPTTIYFGKEDTTTRGVVTYFPKRNLLISSVNPFVNEKTFAYFMSCVKEIKPKYINPEEMEFQELAKKMSEGLTKRREELDRRITDTNANLVSYEKNHLEELKRRKDLLKERELISSENSDMVVFIKNEIIKTKSMPTLKRLEVREDGVHISFGNIFLTSSVKTGMKERDGVEVPKMESKMVDIGEIEIIVNDGKISGKNLTYPSDAYQHPHISQTDCCFGEISGEMNKLIVDFELSKIVKLLYSWLFSYNDNNPFKRIQYFYDREQKKNKEEKK